MRADKFSDRHIGPRSADITEMLQTIGVGSLDELIKKTIPGNILAPEKFLFEAGISEAAYLDEITEISKKNKVFRSFIGQGYYNTFLPSVIRRNMLENPNWYTSYTPYQAEISQGRLEALLNFQTMVMELTGLEMANASLLDEGTAAAEAMIMMFNARPRNAVKEGKNEFFADANMFPQTLDLLKLRAEPLGISLVTGDYRSYNPSGKTFGCMVQYPAADGTIGDYRAFAGRMKEQDILLGVAADLMSLTLLLPPGE